jgi:hypothetical protein
VYPKAEVLRLRKFHILASEISRNRIADLRITAHLPAGLE